ncbi:MAG: hypothetical protein DRH97_01860 [Chloroflexi bacterium]|nr:MAG: hypothetical protein DRH97_01860 [Chloroflexota bacterium]
MGTLVQAAKDRPKIRKKKKDFIKDSKLYQRLVRYEQSGAIDKWPSLDKTKTEEKLGRAIRPPLKRAKEFLTKHDIGP